MNGEGAGRGSEQAMTFTRREFVQLSLGSVVAATAERLFAQGVATHTAKPIKRPAPSGRPFNARFVDVAAAAGLRAPAIYGGTWKARSTFWKPPAAAALSSITTTTAGWISSCSPAPVWTARLRRDQSALQEQSRRHVHRRHRESRASSGRTGPPALCVGDYNNDGFEDLFITYWGQNVLYRNNGDGTFTDVTKTGRLWNEQPAGAPVAPSSTTTATASSTCSSRTMCDFVSSTLPSPARTATATGRAFR